MTAGTQETGQPGIFLFANALQVWAIRQDHLVSVAEAAVAFRCPPLAIMEAVDRHAWMFLSGPDDDYSRLLIEHEGE